VRILITGAAGLVGRALMQRFGNEPDLEEVGLDLVGADTVARSGAVVRGDLEGPALERLVEDWGPEVVVHLAAQVDPPRGKRERARMRALHEAGTRRVARAAKAAGAHLLLVSSAVVYGARASNPTALDEERPVRPNADFPYAVDKAAQERVAREETDALTIARPAIVYGAGARSYLTEILRYAPVVPAVDGKKPPLQFVHVDDLAGALALLARERPGGVFNIASAGTLTADDLGAMLGKRVVPVPAFAVAPLLDAGARVVPARWRAPSYILDYLRHPFVLDTAKLGGLGWTPGYTSADAVRAALGG
jgi:UDP-glucose 4-epimerase